MLAGDVEVDEVLANNNVGDTITIISNLKIQKTKILETHVNAQLQLKVWLFPAAYISDIQIYKMLFVMFLM